MSTLIPYLGKLAIPTAQCIRYLGITIGQRLYVRHQRN